MVVKAAGIVAVAAAIALSAGAANAQLKRITIGSNPSGSTFFLLATGFAKLFQEKLSLRSTAQPHAGSSVYLPLMDRGEITLGLNSSLDSGLAYNGTPPYRRATKKVRMIARIWVLPYGYMVKASSGIKSVADLKGKRVVIKVKTNVSLARLNRTMLSTAGLKESDVKAVDSGGVVKGINMVVEGRADAAPVAIAMPAMRKAHATVPGGLRIISLGKAATDAMMNKGIAGSRTFMSKPSKRRPFVVGNTMVAAFDTYINAGSTVSDADAYKLTKTIYQNWKAMQKAYPPLRGVKQAALAPPTNALPYHPGAIKFYKEVGVWTAANEKRNAMLK
jgi:TRAP transporter TAXI family solute receptor